MVWSLCFGSRPKGNVKQKKKQKQNQNQIQIQKLNDESSPTSAKPERAVLEPQVERAVSEEEDGKVFTYRELATATNNFKVENMVGRGGFGAVYKGTLESTGQEVAVKMLDTSGNQGDKEFLAEVLMLSVVRHEHLVRLIGYCAEGDQRLLVYEYMPLGSVEDHIHSTRDGRKVLDWSTRMKIVAGAAKGLEHLHNVAEPPVIYRDLKTANILLDHGFKAKLSDFGFAKFAPTDGDVSHVSTDVMGTLGYCAPEYAVSGKVTRKSDIYSFGVVMLELISGRKAIMDSCTGPYVSLVHWALPLFNQNKINDIVDPKLTIEGGYMEETLKKALEVAILCLREEANKRPTISEVVIALNYIFQCTKGKKKIKRGGSERGRGRGLERGDSGNKGGTESSPKETPRIMNVKNEIEEDEREKRKRDVADAKIWAELCRERLKKEEH